MRKLFWAELLLFLFLLPSCSSTDENELWLERVENLQPEEALPLYLEAVSSSPSDELLYNLSYTYLQLGMLDEAVSTANQALTNEPNAIRFEYLKAYAFRESGKYYSYERQLRHILSFDPGNADIRHMLIEYYDSSGRRDEAIETAKDALLRNPEDSTAISILGNYFEFYRALAGSSHDKETEYPGNWYNPPSLYDMTDLLTREDRFPSYLQDYLSSLDAKRKTENEKLMLERTKEIEKLQEEEEELEEEYLEEEYEDEEYYEEEDEL